MKNSDAPKPMQKVLRNLGFLLRGRGFAALLTLGSISLMARSLGPVEFGIVVLIQSYFLLIKGLLNFRAFEAIIRYGVPMHDAGDMSGLRRLINVCRRVDQRASLVATALALALAPLAGPLMGLSSDQVILLSIYCLALLTTATSTAGGIFRLFDLFKLFSRLFTIGPTIRFIGVAIAWWFDSPLWVFVIILGAVIAIENLYSLWVCRRIYREKIGHPPENETVHNAKLNEFPGLRHHLWVTYWQSNMDLAPKHLATLLAGYLLGPTEAGLLRLAQDFSKVLAKPAVMIREVALPELTRSWNQGSKAFQHVAYRIALLGGGVGLMFVIVIYFSGNFLLGTLIGDDFVGAVPVLILLLLAASFDLSAASLRSASYAIGYASKVLGLYVGSMFLYLILFVILTKWIGLIGTGIAACVASALPMIFMVLLIEKGKGRRPI